MRIVSGKYRGRTIRAPKNLPVRPTTDMAKEALLNILGSRKPVEGASVLELFAGTGNVSYEFLSRGAGRVLSVDVNPQCVRFIEATLRLLEAENGKAIRFEARRFIARCSEQFDFIFLDPPYAMPDIADVILEIFENELLNPEGLLILEHASNLSFMHLPQHTESRAYGQSAFTFFQYPSSD